MPSIQPPAIKKLRVLCSKFKVHFLLFTVHFSAITSHLSPLISHLSSLTSHLSPLTSHLSSLTSHLSPLTSHLSPFISLPFGKMSAGQRGFFFISYPTLSGASHADKSAVVASLVDLSAPSSLTALTPATSRNQQIYEFTNLRIYSIKKVAEVQSPRIRELIENK